MEGRRLKVDLEGRRQKIANGKWKIVIENGKGEKKDRKILSSKS